MPRFYDEDGNYNEAAADGYAEYIMDQREMNKFYDEQYMNTPKGKFAPADFIYDPLKESK